MRRTIVSMGANNEGAWGRLYYVLNTLEGYSPREMKSWAMALTILGYSSRQIERELRARFPGEKTPNFATIAHWQRSRPHNHLAYLRWSDVAARATEILETRLDDIERLPIEKRLMAAFEATEMFEIGQEGWLRTRERRRKRREQMRQRRPG
jgi:hypothetical protein